MGALALRTSLSKTSISTIESGTGNPSLETLWRLADALGVTLGMLLGEHALLEPEVVRRGGGAAFASSSGIRGRVISVARREHRAEVMELTFEGPVHHESPRHPPGTEEMLICIRGRMEVGPANRTIEVEPGDAVVFQADQPHVYGASAEAQALLIMFYPTTGARIVVSAPPDTVGASRTPNAEEDSR